jgi:hypothetical protein
MSYKDRPGAASSSRALANAFRKTRVTAAVKSNFANSSSRAQQFQSVFASNLPEVGRLVIPVGDRDNLERKPLLNSLYGVVRSSGIAQEFHNLLDPIPLH